MLKPDRAITLQQNYRSELSFISKTYGMIVYIKNIQFENTSILCFVCLDNNDVHKYFNCSTKYIFEFESVITFLNFCTSPMMKRKIPPYVDFSS